MLSLRKCNDTIDQITTINRVAQAAGFEKIFCTYCLGKCCAIALSGGKGAPIVSGNSPTLSLLPASPSVFLTSRSFLFFCGCFVHSGMRSTLLQWQLASGFYASPIWKPVGRPAFSWTKHHTSGDWRYREKLQTNLLQQLSAGGSSLFKREG